MKRLSILFALVIAACGDGKTEPKNIEVRLPNIEAPQAGFGSAAVSSTDNKQVVVENKAGSELPPVEHWIPIGDAECMKLGKEMHAKGEHARARELYEAAAKLDRTSATPHVELARSYIEKSERALAVRHAKKAVKLAPESSQAHNTLGRAELLRHDYDGAELAFRQATELDPTNVWAWNNLGLVHLTRNNYQEAVTALVEATSHERVESYMWNNLGSAYEQLDQLDDARDAFDRGAKLGSASAAASRKRLNNVDTITASRLAKRDSKEPSFETREEMPEPVIDDEQVEIEVEEGVLDQEIKDAAEAPKTEPSKTIQVR